MDTQVNGNVGSVVVVEDFSDIFITENDFFDIKIRYHKDGENIFVEGVDESFNKNGVIKEFTVTFKYPDQSDVTRISSTFPKVSSVGEIDARDFMKLEFSRLLCLIRKWSLNKPVDDGNIMSLNPKIVKSMVSKIREKIGADGII